MVNVGDTVYYLPHEAHALQADRNGDYAWVMGRKIQRPTTGGRFVADVEELSGKDLRDYLELIRRHPDPERERANLVFLRPAKPWTAQVTAVHDDGSADLDIVSPNGGITLHYPGVPNDETQQKPHSFYTGKGG